MMVCAAPLLLPVSKAWIPSVFQQVPGLCMYQHLGQQHPAQCHLLYPCALQHLLQLCKCGSPFSPTACLSLPSSHLLRDTWFHVHFHDLPSSFLKPFLPNWACIYLPLWILFTHSSPRLLSVRHYIDSMVWLGAGTSL